MNNRSRIFSDFDDDLKQLKLRAAMDNQPFIEKEAEPAPFITCYMCESKDCEEIRFGNKKQQNFHVLHLCKKCQRKMGQFLIGNALTGPIRSFEEFYYRLQYKTAEEIIKESGFDKVKAHENIVKDDEFLAEFLENINAEIDDYNDGFCLIHCGDKWYEVPYQENWLDWGNVLSFRHDTVYDVTDSYES